MKIFNLPDLGEGLAEAEIREWYVNEGDDVKVDQPLVSMETAKAVVDVPSPYAGKIIQLHGKANEIVKTGAPLISFETGESQEVSKDKGSVVGALEVSSESWHEENLTIGKPKSATQSIKAMPAARVLAKELEVDLGVVKGTGPGGLITADDVKKSVQIQKTAYQFEGEAVHGVRRVMANVMTTSHHEVAATTIIEDADISHLPKTDLTVLLLKAIVKAVDVEPSLNAWFDGTRLVRKVFQEVNIGLAVDSPEGLFVPVIKDMQKKTSDELRGVIAQYKEQIQNRSIPAANLQGATISLSNFGTISGRYATPVIVPPMVAILACGRGRETPVVRDGTVAVGKVLPLSLTFDHRAVTGGEASRFLGAVIDYLKSAVLPS